MIAGIDLGTTHSLIGIYDSGFPTLLANNEGSRLTPSVVYYSKKGVPTVGRSAERQRLLHPERTVSSIKRLMGRRFDDPECRGYDQLIKAPDGSLLITLGEKQVTPEEVSSEILKELKQVAEQNLKQPITRAVITVPAYFNDAQRAATRRAGEIAGFTVERIISEPTAAALAYGLDKLNDQSTIAVYDLGGGTFDLSILKLDRGIFQVLSTHGDTQLGGDTIDQALAAFFIEQADLSEKELSLTARTRLLEAARKAKEELSSLETTSICLPFLQENLNIEFTLTRSQLEKITAPIIEQTRAHCLRALADAKIHPSELDEIILVGGSTRIPLVHSFVQKLFRKPPNLTQHPEEAVAIGAILQGALLEGNLSQITLLDITPLSLGIETFGGLMNVIIPRNTTIPTKAGELFTNAVAGQNAMKITLLQGERERALDNWRLGELEINFPPAPKGTARVGVQFEIDADGILQVLARDTISGTEKKIALQNAIEISDEAVEAMLADSLEHAFEDMNARIFTEARLKAEEMLPAVDTALLQLANEIPHETQLSIRALADKVTSAIQEETPVPLKKALQELDEATQTLATLLIEKAMTNGGQASNLTNGGQASNLDKSL